MQVPRIIIVGAGISGLTAARVLENHQMSAIILESKDHIGGRVTTDFVQGYQLDRGFQVLLDAYPYAQKYLNMDALELQPLAPGADIFFHRKRDRIGDPTRQFNLLLPTLFAGVGTFRDKLRILALNRALKKKTLEDIFNTPEQTTRSYLKERGFSNQIIERFFQPFFSGIFLESELHTSSRMFEFVYKMFGEGHATLPKDGIGAIPAQIASELRQTEILLNTHAKEVKPGIVFLKDGSTLEADYLIIATDPSTLLPAVASDLRWKSCDNLYFEVDKPIIKGPFIGLKADDGLINNFFYPQSVATASRGNAQLLSVTVVKNHGLQKQALVQQVQKELKTLGHDSARLLVHYAIPKALPELRDLKYNQPPTTMTIMEGIALAGDHHLNGSLNAAMAAGEAAAVAAIDHLAVRTG